MEGEAVALVKRKGQAIVEFAVVLPVLILIVLGIAVLGKMFFDYLTVQNAAREGARAAAVGKTDAEIVQIVRDRAKLLNVNNLRVKITPPEDERTAGEPVTVEVWYEHYHIPIFGLIANPRTLYGRATMRVEVAPEE